MSALPFDPAFALAPQDGPYGILDERRFFERNPGLFYNGTRADNVPVAFQPELGSTSCPEYESLARFMSPAALADFPSEGARPFSVNPVWVFHKYLPFTDNEPMPKGPGVDHLYAYGAPANASEYALRAQLAQYRQYHALFEGFQEFMFVYYGAVIMWKTNSPWPALR